MLDVELPVGEGERDEWWIKCAGNCDRCAVEPEPLLAFIAPVLNWCSMAKDCGKGSKLELELDSEG